MSQFNIYGKPPRRTNNIGELKKRVDKLNFDYGIVTRKIKKNQDSNNIYSKLKFYNMA